ncbi:hypothetical protein HJC23_008834 [Cyclotella cryptica]|uniref:Uncharacterized protein n=1 Tax=Cyclotella cryptica TaxID=29204 RepID=A0ABD3QBK6_9STRA
MPSQSIESRNKCTMSSLVPGSYQVPTFFEKVSMEINLIDLTVSDLSKLKQSDPFLYYSIPAVRKAAMHGAIVDELSIDATTSSKISTSRAMHISCFESSDSDDDVDADEKNAVVNIEAPEKILAFCQVNRQSRLSFESPDLTVLDELYAFDSDDEHDVDDFILAFLESYAKLSTDE